MSSQFRACLVAVIAVLGAVGCGNADRVISGQTVDTVEVTPPATVIPIGASVRLLAVPLDDQGHMIAGATVVWESSNTAVATVDATGFVHAVSAGTVTITASSEGVSGSAQVQVSNVVVDSVDVSPPASVITVGTSVRLTAVALDDLGQVIVGALVVWQSSNPAIATVDATGLVHAVTAGSVTISATFAGVSGSGTVEVDDSIPLPGYHLAFSTYLGGALQDQIRDIAVDAQDNVYVTGGAQSPTFPTTPGSYDPTFNGNYDVFVAKISPTGQLLWSTFIGGPNYDRAYGIEVDELGYVYIAGRAGAGFPVTAGAFQTQFGGSPNVPPYGPQDGFVCKITPDGTSIVFCSYFGTSDRLMVRDLAIDAQHAIYLASSHESGNYPVASWFTGSYRSTPVGGRDAVIAKVAPDGASIEWATYVGGTGDEAEQPSIKVDAAGNVFALYSTESSDMPTPNGFDHTLGGTSDLYLLKLSPDGKQLLFGTYVGGISNEGVETHELALDPQGNPVIGNGSSSPDYPTTPGVIQPILAGPSDAVITRIAADGSHVLASTFFGGLGTEHSEGISIDPQGNVYFTGSTSTVGLSYLLNGLQPAPKGQDDMMVVKLSPDLKTVLYGTYFGGSDKDPGRAAAVSPTGAFVFGGTTLSHDFPTLNPIQPNQAGDLDAQVARIAP